MIQRLEISGVHTEVGDDLKRYVMRKIGRLDRYLPRRIRQSLHAEVKLKEDNKKGKQLRTCEVVMFVPGEMFTVKESTINMFAAVDIVEEKLKGHLKKYKGLHTDPKIYRHLFNRFRRKR